MNPNTMICMYNIKKIKKYSKKTINGLKQEPGHLSLRLPAQSQFKGALTGTRALPLRCGVVL
jgi:hypothetical protein